MLMIREEKAAWRSCCWEPSSRGWKEQAVDLQVMMPHPPFCRPSRKAGCRDTAREYQEGDAAPTPHEATLTH